MIGLECADLSAAVDPSLGCGLTGVWRRVAGVRRPLVPASPVPDTTPSELAAAWPGGPPDRSVPIRIVHRTPLSISWAWPDGAIGRWELTPTSLCVGWTDVDEVNLAARVPADVRVERPAPNRLVLHPPEVDPSP